MPTIRATIPLPLVCLVLACTSQPGGGDEAGEGELTGASAAGSDGSESASDTTSGAMPDVPSEPEPCDIFAQDCPDGYKCTYDLWGEPFTVCAPISGSKPRESECSTDYHGHDDCDASSMCWGLVLFDSFLCIDGVCPGTCKPFCVGSPDQHTCPGEQEGDSKQRLCSIDDPRRNHLAICASDCDPFAQNCPEPDEKCIQDLSYACVQVLGDLPPGSPCNWGGPDLCDANSVCWQGACHAMCEGDWLAPHCSDGFECEFYDGLGPMVCVPSCDPLAQACGDGYGCYWTGGGFDCVYTAAGHATGQPCGHVNDCAAGHLCAEAASLPACAGSSCCTPFCDLLQGDAGCLAQPGTSCVAFLDQPAPGYEDVGVCVVAP